MTQRKAWSQPIQGFLMGFILVPFLCGLAYGEGDTVGQLWENLKGGKVVAVDMSHALSPEVPVADITPKPKIKPFLRANQPPLKMPFNSNRIELDEHTGTHIDFPYHGDIDLDPTNDNMLAGDRVPLERLIGPAVVIDISQRVKEALQKKGKEGLPAWDPAFDVEVTAADLQAWEKAHGPIPEGSYVIMHSGWSRFWPQKKPYLNGFYFPGFSAEAVQWLLKNRQIKGLGGDNLGVDVGANLRNETFPAHKLGFPAGWNLLENLTNTGLLPPKGALLFIGAMKIQGGTGAPSRVMALCERP